MICAGDREVARSIKRDPRLLWAFPLERCPER